MSEIGDKIDRLMSRCPSCGAMRTHFYWWPAAGNQAADYECGARFVVKNDRLVEAYHLCASGADAVIAMTRHE
jgi:hypothetical protein